MFWAILFMFQTICDSSYCYFDHSFKQIIGLVIIGLLSAALRIVLTKVLNYYFPNFKTNRSNDFWLIWIFQRRGAGAILIGGRHLNGAAFIRANMVISKSNKMK